MLFRQCHSGTQQPSSGEEVTYFVVSCFGLWFSLMSLDGGGASCSVRGRGYMEFRTWAFDPVHKWRRFGCLPVGWLPPICWSFGLMLISLSPVDFALGLAAILKAPAT